MMQAILFDVVCFHMFEFKRGSEAELDSRGRPRQPRFQAFSAHFQMLVAFSGRASTSEPDSTLPQSLNSIEPYLLVTRVFSRCASDMAFAHRAGVTSEVYGWDTIASRSNGDKVEQQTSSSMSNCMCRTCTC